MTLVRGGGRLTGVGVVDVDGTRLTAAHVVLANGADAFVPPIPACANSRACGERERRQA
jgi:pyruvate/2-oxoglutarate dehydrogenase complex dihydrolipoamide dehydrogenase (E3) component